VSLKTFSEDLEEFLSAPERFPEDEARIYRQDIERWRANGNCVLQWGNSHYLNRDGITI
jgi:hypothetical protein